MSYIVRTALPRDFVELGALHIQVFPAYFLSRMGSDCVVELYRAIENYTGGVVLVLEYEGEVIGFCVGSATPAGSLKAAIARRPRFFWVVALRACRNWRLVVSVIGKYKRFRRPDEVVFGAKLWSIGVSPRFQGRGGASLLLEKFLNIAKMSGSAAVTATTDAQNNVKVVAFYERHGFKNVAQWSEGSRQLYAFRYDIK